MKKRPPLNVVVKRNRGRIGKVVVNGRRRVKIQMVGFVAKREIFVVVVFDGNFFGVGIKNANIKSDGLKFLDENFERFGNAGSGNVKTFDDSFVSFDAADNVVGFDGENFL